MRITQGRFAFLIFVLMSVLCFMSGSGKKSKQVVVSDKLLDAICMVESNCDPGVADGDNGKALGMFQIWESFHADALEFDPSIGGCYEDVKNKDYAKKIIRAYMQRYAPNNATDEQIARIFNGGPKALSKKRLHLTDKYWNKIRKNLD